MKIRWFYSFIYLRNMFTYFLFSVLWGRRLGIVKGAILLDINNFNIFLLYLRISSLSGPYPTYTMLSGPGNSVRQLRVWLLPSGNPPTPRIPRSRVTHRRRSAKGCLKDCRQSWRRWLRLWQKSLLGGNPLILALLSSESSKNSPPPHDEHRPYLRTPRKTVIQIVQACRKKRKQFDRVANMRWTVTQEHNINYSNVFQIHFLSAFDRDQVKRQHHPGEALA